MISSDIAAYLQKCFIKHGAVVFDVGAKTGDWSARLLSIQSDLTIHAFEPTPDNNTSFCNNLDHYIHKGTVIPNNCYVGRSTGLRSYTYQQDAIEGNRCYGQKKAEENSAIKETFEISVPEVSIDSYCDFNQLNHIDFLKIDGEGGELDALIGAQTMLRWGRIDHVQFKYDDTYVAAHITLKEIFELLDSHRYGIFSILPEGMKYCPLFRPELENYENANYLAVNERLLPTYLGFPQKMLNLRALFMKHRVKPRGIIHIGAHEGQEITQYSEMGVERVLFIEANPEVYQRLAERIDGMNGVIAVQCAVSDFNGTICLHVTSNNQSSSVLPLKRHQDIYPSITEVSTVEVPCRTLDTLLAELKLDPAWYNIINIDIQGAELLALKGSQETLSHIEAINSEVNYEELYEGCARIWEIDAFLDTWGFERVATVTPYHPSWGDGLYIKSPIVTMSALGTKGRFANQLFQYAFLRCYSRKHLLNYQTPLWIGEKLFGHHGSRITKCFPLLRENSYCHTESLMVQSTGTFKSVDLWGYFQYHTSYYAPQKDFFTELFQPVPIIRDAVEKAYEKLTAFGSTVVGLHLRRGDYGFEYFFVAPNQWYVEWLEEIWPTLEKPVLFIATDGDESVLEDFKKYNPITSKILGVSIEDADFYPDFYLLSRCHITAISNSSFSFAATMLNTNGNLFYRPSLSLRKLIPYEPWNSEVLLRDTHVQTDCNREPNFSKSAAYYTPSDSINAVCPELPKVSVIVPTCNRAGILVQFLNALARQTYPADHFEVIICDDGSTDHTQAVISGYPATFPLIYLKKGNGGPASARNESLKAASGEIVLILNDDAIAAPDLIEKHVASHHNPARKTIVLGSFDFTAKHVATPLMETFLQSKVLFQYNGMRSNEWYDFRYFWTCNISLPRSAFEESGLFDEDFIEPAGEDIELGYRLQQKGYSIRYSKECRTEHAHRISFFGYCRRQTSVGRNNILLAMKHPEITGSVTSLNELSGSENELRFWIRRNEEIVLSVFNAIRTVADVEMDAGQRADLASKIDHLLPIVNQYFLYQGYMEGLEGFCFARPSPGDRLALTFLTPGTTISGGVKIIFEYCNRLAERGHTINLVALSGGKPPWFSFNSGVTFIAASWDEEHLISVMPDADAVFATYWASAYLVARLPAAKGRRFYLVQDYESESIATPEQADMTYLLPLRRIVVSMWLQDRLHGLFKQKSAVVTNAIDHNTLYPDPAVRSLYPAKDFRIGMLWHHEKRKGTVNGLKAFEILKKRCPQVRLVLMGTNRPQGLECCEFFENIHGDDVRRFYASLDIFCSTSNIEGFGLPGLEAMACGIPLVTTDSGGVRDYAQQGITALLVKPGDPNALADAIFKLIGNTELRASLSRAGIAKAHQFAWNASVSLMEQIIRLELDNAGKYSGANQRTTIADTNDKLKRYPMKRLKITVFSLDAKDNACGHYRIQAPLNQPDGDVELSWGMEIREKDYHIKSGAAESADIIIVQRFFPRPETARFLDYLCSLGKPIIFEIDDLLTQLPPTNWNYGWGMLSTPHICKFIRKCTAVTVSTEELKNHYSSFSDTIHILPSLLDSKLWHKTSPSSSAPVVIGYAGTITNNTDLLLLEEVLDRIALRYGSRVAFTFMGCATERISRLPGFSFIQFEETFEAYARKLQEIPVDIMLAPLEDNSFNRCKSNIKWLEYSSCGIAGIYADLPPYNTTVTHGETGLLVGGEPEQWFQAISLLIDRPDFRQAMARKARAEVLASHTLRSRAYRWLEVYREVLGRSGSSGNTVQLTDKICKTRDGLPDYF
jgi:FkbM family methyltransferase